MSSARQQIEIIKRTYLNNECDSNMLNGIISEVGILQNTAMSAELIITISQ